LIKNKYIRYNKEIIIKKKNNKSHLLKSHQSITNNTTIFKILNWYKNNSYYIKNINNNKYLTIDYDNDEIILSDNKTCFEIYEKDNNIIEIKLGIYYFNRYNCISKFRNENIFIKYFKDNKEREILKEDISRINNSFLLKFIKYNCYLNVKNNSSIDINTNKNDRWIFEKVNNKSEYINCTRFIKNNKFYYKNIDTNEIYTNYYMGWGLENVLW
jgi:hypothetical protein